MLFLLCFFPLLPPSCFSFRYFLFSQVKAKRNEGVFLSPRERVKIMRLVECIPNFSEGRRDEVIQEIVDAILSVRGVYLLDKEADRDHNRSVITVVGNPESVAEAVFRGAKRASELIDLNKHEGEHPRIGATDVIPFVPISDVSMDDCVELAKKVAKRISDELGIPTYLYEEAATRDDRKNLANIRRGQFEGLREEVKTNPDRRPDFGPSELHPTAGATVVGARAPLIAYNVYLGTNNIDIAKQIARNVRHSGGGLRYVKAMGFEIKERGLVQVSMNMVNYEGTPLHRVFELIKAEALRYGVSTVEGEIVGLVPQDALFDASEFYLQLNNFSRDQILERRLQSVLESQSMLVDKTVVDFLDDLSSDSAVPGGGSSAALSGAMGAALGSMVARLTLKKKDLSSVHAHAKEILDRCEQSRERLIQLIDEDSQAFSEVMSAFRLPKSTSEEQEHRKKMIQNAFRKATDVPLETARVALTALKEMLELVEIGYKDAISDCASGAQMLFAAIQSALLNVRINLGSLGDEALISQYAKEISEFDQEASRLLSEIMDKTLRALQSS